MLWANIGERTGWAWHESTRDARSASRPGGGRCGPDRQPVRDRRCHRSLGAAAEETTIAVLVSVTPAGRQVVDCATSRRRELIADILARLPISGQRAVAHALREFAAAAGEAPDDQWPPTVPDLEGSVPRSRTPLQRAHPRLLHDGTGERP